MSDDLRTRLAAHWPALLDGGCRCGWRWDAVEPGERLGPRLIEAYNAHLAAALADLLADAPTPAQPAAPQGEDVERLEYALDLIDKMPRSNTYRRQAELLLDSDWLAAHDAEVRANAARETAERIAGAIEGEREQIDPESLGWYDGIRQGLSEAARIARAEGER